MLILYCLRLFPDIVLPPSSDSDQASVFPGLKLGTLVPQPSEFSIYERTPASTSEQAEARRK